MISVVPGVTPVTIPEPAPIVATPGEELLHTPPPLFVNDVVPDTHTFDEPAIADGCENTWNMFVDLHPVDPKV